jgi:hypothetical protein
VTALVRGSRAWLQFSDPSTWRLATDDALQRQILSAHAAAHCRRLTFTTDLLVTGPRVIDACSLCGSTIENDDLGPCCEGARIVRVPVYPFASLGVARAPVLGTDGDLERLGLQTARVA